jgi:hypothetical protein
MVITKKRSSAAGGVSQAMIEQASSMLQELPEKPRDNWSLREAVNLLQDSIIAALDRGYTYEEVAVLLGNKGVKIAAPSLKRYLAAVKREQGSTKTRRSAEKGKKAAVQSLTSSNASSNVANPTANASQTTAKKAASRSKAQSKAEPKVAAKKTQAKPTARAQATGARKKTNRASS